MGSLTKLQRSVIIGSLFGDGYLRIVPGRRDAFLEINHSFTQKEYVDWKYSVLKSLCRSAPKARRGNGGRIAYRFTTRQRSEFSELYGEFYKSGRKCIPSAIRIDPITLAVWFMDDGSKSRERDVYLNTQQFAREDQERCISLLESLGVESRLNKDKEYTRIRILKSSLRRFWNIVAPHVIASMSYKLGYNPVETSSELELSYLP